MLPTAPSYSLNPRGRSSDWAHDGGIYRPVHLLVTPASYVERLDITAAVQEGTLFMSTHLPLSTNDLTRLSLAFPWTPWVFHMLDYI